MRARRASWVSSRLPYPTDPSGDGETSGVSIINMASDNCTELPTVSSSTDAARSTTSLVCDPPGSRTADIDDRHLKNVHGRIKEGLVANIKHSKLLVNRSWLGSK